LTGGEITFFISKTCVLPHSSSPFPMLHIGSDQHLCWLFLLSSSCTGFWEILQRCSVEWGIHAQWFV